MPSHVAMLQEHYQVASSLQTCADQAPGLISQVRAHSVRSKLHPFVLYVLGYHHLKRSLHVAWNNLSTQYY